MQLYTSIEARRQVRASWKKQEQYIYILLTETRRKKHKTGEPSSDHGDGARSHCHHRKPLFLAVHCIHLRRKFSGRLAPPHARGDDNDEQGETNEIWNGEATSLLQHFSCHWLWHAVNSLLDNQTFNFSFVPDIFAPDTNEGIWYNIPSQGCVGDSSKPSGTNASHLYQDMIYSSTNVD